MHRPLLGVLVVSLASLALTPAHAKEEAATVIGVVDGDTIEVTVAGSVEKVHLIGVDTSETVDPRKPVQAFGKEASEFTRKLVDGKKVVLRDELGGQDRDKYGRLLRYVYLGDGTFVNTEIIRQGYGHAYVVFPFHSTNYAPIYGTNILRGTTAPGHSDRQYPVRLVSPDCQSGGYMGGGRGK